MFKTSVGILRDPLRESPRRERALLDMVRELNDRLAAAHGQPWTLPPRPVEAMVRDEREELDVDDPRRYEIEI